MKSLGDDSGALLTLQITKQGLAFIGIEANGKVIRYIFAAIKNICAFIRDIKARRVPMNFLNSDLIHPWKVSAIIISQPDKRALKNLLYDTKTF
jgi:hypothetical protein